MASLSDKKIQRLIEIKLDITGNSKESRALVAGVTSDLKALGLTAERDVRNAIVRLTAELKRNDAGLILLAKDSERTTKSIKGISESFNILGGHIRSTIPLFGLIGTELIGFDKSVKFVTDFNKSLLTTSSQFSKYGVGISAVGDSLDRLVKQTTLTRTESMKLMSSYEHGFNFTSLERGEQLLMNLKKSVGANSEAMQEMSGFLQGVIAKFPELEDSITRMNGLDRSRIETQSRLLYLSGQLSFSDSKRLRDYANQNAQLNTQDMAKKAAAEAEIEAMNRFSVAVEKVALQIGNVLVPFMETLSGWVTKGADGLERWIPALVGIAAALPALDVGFKALKFGNMLSGGSMAKGFMSVRSNPWGGAGLGAATGYGVGKAYDYGYGVQTGQDYEHNAGRVARMGKGASMIGAGAANGGVPGAIAGGLTFIGEETTTALKDIHDVWSANNDIYEAQKKGAAAVLDLATKAAQKASEATGVEKEYRDYIKQAQTERAAAEKNNNRQSKRGH